MPIELLLVQFLVLAFTGALWWLARRDLTSRAALPPASGASPDLEPLLATLETVVTELARRLDRVEREMAEPTPPQAATLPKREGEEGGAAWLSLSLPPPASGGVANLFAGVGSLDAMPQDARYAPVYALIDEGIADPQDIARRTGLSRGEVDLILSLRARRAL